MAAITINQKKCKGCGLCVGACPKQLLELDRELLNEKGYHPAKCGTCPCASAAPCARPCAPTWPLLWKGRIMTWLNEF